MFCGSRMFLSRAATVMSFTLSEYVGYPKSALWATLTLNRESARHPWEIEMHKSKAKIYLNALPKTLLEESVLARELLCDNISRPGLHTAQILSVNGVAADTIHLVRRAMNSSNVLELQLLIRSRDLSKSQKFMKGKVRKGSRILADGHKAGVETDGATEEKVAGGARRGRGRPRSDSRVRMAEPPLVSPPVSSANITGAPLLARWPADVTDQKSRRGKKPSDLTKVSPLFSPAVSPGVSIVPDKEVAPPPAESDEVEQYHL
ncbi:hypothetical protein, conserved [Trypanosoma brucei gambiense DAL972]|uniref:Uncharacterized protein n=1 Tax=Trypanosoma brucei gambiense (strain MHOM/CI/86/DAL972) TaxID=679716 RepID=D0A840_TRYB9|nr:hypothetical protein, conserved [Trypanosoma brucei gambiense DAL972]CBH17841.1 hypothetical protein, conserved [Trypanosoma brucei gambiense DAL972]|eukprot:XP_011780105.1 hypothetical protein, conserved [Trypanosoma brucei gambiense DAL972]